MLVALRYIFYTFGMLIDVRYIADTLMFYSKYLLIDCYMITNDILLIFFKVVLISNIHESWLIYDILLIYYWCTKKIAKTMQCCCYIKTNNKFIFDLHSIIVEIGASLHVLWLWPTRLQWLHFMCFKLLRQFTNWTDPLFSRSSCLAFNNQRQYSDIHLYNTPCSIRSLTHNCKNIKNKINYNLHWHISILVN